MSCFVIHSVAICLLIEAFNPFALKVIVDRNVFIAVLLFIFLSFFSSSYGRPFKISCNTGLVVMNFFSFLLSGKLFICLILNYGLAG